MTCIASYFIFDFYGDKQCMHSNVLLYTINALLNHQGESEGGIYYSSLMFSRHKFPPCRILWLMSQNPHYILSKKLMTLEWYFLLVNQIFCQSERSPHL